jgi:hypothetical protein
MADRAPGNATVGDMGMNPALVNRLSAAGKQLTKDDLVQLWSNKITDNAAKATLGDIELVKQGFAPVAAATSNAEAGDVNCCCCPCCCATAVIKPIREIA